MVGTIELDPSGSLLMIRFDYREDLVEVMRALPDRRWDKGAKAWTVPAAWIDDVVPRLIGYGFTMDSEVSAMFAGTVPKPPPPPARPARPADEPAPRRRRGRRPRQAGGEA